MIKILEFIRILEFIKILEFIRILDRKALPPQYLSGQLRGPEN
jgi:hypothetical protein